MEDKKYKIEKILNNTSLVKVGSLTIYLLVFICYFELFYRQSIAYNGLYPSDLGAHIAGAVNGEGSYSLVSNVFNFLIGINGSTIYIPMLLAAIVVGTLLLTNKFLCILLPNRNKLILCVFSFLVTISVSLYFPALNPNLHLGALTVGWHNSTYLAMKFFGLLCFIVYFKLRKHCLEKLSMIEWLVFATLLILINSVKPNFIIAFAPAMLIMLVKDFIKTRGKSWKRIMIFGSSVIPSFVVLVYQYAILFPSSDGGIAFGFATLLRSVATYPWIALVQVMLFPLIVFIINFKSIFKDEKYNFILLTWSISFLQYIFIQESGDRVLHGNFAWGVIFFWFLLFLYSTKIMIDKIDMFKQDAKKERLKVYVMFIGFMLHVCTGCYYMYRIFMGFAPW